MSMSARFLIVIVLFCRQILVFTGVVLGIQLLGISFHLTGATAAAPNTSKSRVQELERLLARARAELATCNEALGIAVAEIASLKAESAATASALAASQAELNDTKSTLAARDAELAACKA